LYELGIILRSCARARDVEYRNRKSEEILNNWYGSNLDGKGLTTVLSSINGASSHREKKSDGAKEESEQLKNIRRVINVMGGKK